MNRVSRFRFHRGQPQGGLEWLIFLLGLSGSLFLLFWQDFSYLSPAPLLLVSLLLLLPKLGHRSDQVILFAFVALALALDDIGHNPWLRVEAWSEILGQLLFLSKGLTGLELFVLLFSLALWLLSKRQQRDLWRQQALLPLLVISSLYLFTCLLALGIGLAKGGDLMIGFIQLRFQYLFPLWVFVGFVVLREAEILKKFLSLITVMVAFKALQGLSIYALHRDLYADAEYVYEHFFSSHITLAFLSLSFAFWRIRHPLFRLLCVLVFAIVLGQYLLDERRTSYIGLGLAMLTALFFWQPRLIRQHWPKAVLVMGLTLVFLLLSWNSEGPLGFLGRMYRSFGTEGGAGPSYRDLEIANMLQEIAQSPVLGMGFGHEFAEVFPMPSVAHVYTRYKMIPHNMLVSSWCYGGPMVLASLCLVFVLMIGLALHLLRSGQSLSSRLAGAALGLYSLQYLSYAFGDLGMQVTKNQMMAGLLLGACFRIWQGEAQSLTHQMTPTPEEIS